MKYVLYIKHDGDWLFWQNDFGWANIGKATLFERDTPKILPGSSVHDPFVDLVIEGKWIAVGEAGELAPLAPAILDLLEVLEENGTQSYLPRVELASRLARSLRQADPMHLDLEAIYENGYCFRVVDEVDDSEV